MNYLVIGDDKYIHQREVDRINKKYISDEEAELNYSTHEAEDVAGIMDALGTVPFLADKRVVLVKEAERLSDLALESIISYLEKPSDTGVLILSSGNSLKKNKHYKKLSSSLEVVSADKPTPQTIKSWIRKFFNKEKIDISPRAVDLITQLKGQDTSGIKMELDKLAAYSGGNKIEAEDVEQLVGRSVTETIFKLVDALNASDTKWTFKILSDLYETKKQPHEIIGYLSWYLRIIQKIVLLSRRGSSVKDIAADLKYSTGYVNRLYGQAKKYSVKKIKRWTELLLEADKDIKTGRKQPSLALEMLLTTLAA